MSQAKPESVRAVAMTAPGNMEVRSYPYPQLDCDSAILKDMYIMPGTSLFKIPEDLPTDVAVFVEEFAVAYHSLARAATPFAAVSEGFGPGATVAVLGNGPLRLLHGYHGPYTRRWTPRRHGPCRSQTHQGQGAVRRRYYQRFHEHPFGLSLRDQLAASLETPAEVPRGLSIRLPDFAPDEPRRTGGRHGGRDDSERVRQGRGCAPRGLSSHVSTGVIEKRGLRMKCPRLSNLA